MKSFSWNHTVWDIICGISISVFNLLSLPPVGIPSTMSQKRCPWHYHQHLRFWPEKTSLGPPLMTVLGRILLKNLQDVNGRAHKRDSRIIKGSDPIRCFTPTIPKDGGTIATQDVVLIRLSFTPSAKKTSSIFDFNSSTSWLEILIRVHKEKQVFTSPITRSEVTNVFCTIPPGKMKSLYCSTPRIIGWRAGTTSQSLTYKL